MKWFKKKPPSIPVEKVEAAPADLETSNSIFSTHGGNVPKARRTQYVQAALAKSFQVDLPTNGAPMMAMDDSNDVAEQISVKKNLLSYRSVINHAQLGYFAGQGFIGFHICAMLMQNWLIDKACTMPARDAVRMGYDIAVMGGKEVKPELLEALRNMDKEFNVNGQMEEFVRFGRCFGIRIAMFQIESDDPDFYKNPFNIDGVQPDSYKGIAQIDPQWCAPQFSSETLNDPTSPQYYEPTWWNIAGKLVHKSHLVIMRTSEVADVLKPTYSYAGVSIPQKIYERVYAAERTANEAPQLAATKRMTVMKVDMMKVVLDSAAFNDTMQTWTELANNYGVKVIGMDEEIEQQETSLTDLDAVIMTQYQIVAAAANVPITKLLGTTPKGFNSTGEYEEASYHEELESVQTHDLTPLLNRHHLLCIKSKIAPDKANTFEVAVNWAPLDSPTAKEEADLQKTKAETGAVLINSGAIDAEMEMQRVVSDPSSGYNGLEVPPPDDVDDPDAAALNYDPVDVPLSQAALNGPQITSLQGILNAVAAGTLPRDSALALMKASFPLTDAQAENIMGTIGKGFVPATPPAPETDPQGDDDENDDAATA